MVVINLKLFWFRAVLKTRPLGPLHKLYCLNPSIAYSRSFHLNLSSAVPLDSNHYEWSACSPHVLVAPGLRRGGLMFRLAASCYHLVLRIKPCRLLPSASVAVPVVRINRTLSLAYVAPSCSHQSHLCLKNGSKVPRLLRTERRTGDRNTMGISPQRASGLS